MKAFLAGLLFLIAVGIFAGIGILLFPLFVLMFWLVRFIVMVGLLLFSIWLLGKFIIFVWEKIR